MNAVLVVAKDQKRCSIPGGLKASERGLYSPYRRKLKISVPPMRKLAGNQRNLQAFGDLSREKRSENT